MPKTVKKPKCKECGEEFERFRTTQKVCGYQCAAATAEKESAKRKEKEWRVEKKKRKDKLKKKSDWLAECQTAFNAYIRARDKGDNCISCDKSIAELKINHHIVMVCGHYKSVGAHPELRFTPENGNLQCTRCNGGAGKYGQFNSKEKTVTQSYRVNLIKKIGIDRVEWLEGKHELPHWTVIDVKEIKAEYKLKLKELER